MTRNVARLYLIGAAVLFSTGGAAIKACTFTSWQKAAFRSIIAAGAILLLIPASRRGWTRSALAVALTYGATMVLFVAANDRTTSANAIFLQDTAPLYVLLAGPLLLHERVTRRDVSFMIAVFAGLILFFVGREAAQKSAPDPFTGNVLALVAGVTWAGTIVGLRWLGRTPEGRRSNLAAIVMGNLAAFTLCIPLALPIENNTPANWAVVAYLGLFQIGLAYVLLTRAMAHIPALEASCLLLIEPVINPFWSFALHGERPGAWAIAGGAIILGATLWKALGERDLRPPARASSM